MQPGSHTGAGHSVTGQAASHRLAQTSTEAATSQHVDEAASGPQLGAGQRLLNSARIPRPAQAGLKVISADKTATVRQRNQYRKPFVICLFPAEIGTKLVKSGKDMQVMLVRKNGPIK